MSGYIGSREKIRDRYDDREDREEESAVFLACECLISEDELDREESEYHEGYECESTRETRNSIREIHRVKNQHIPKYRHCKRDVVYPVISHNSRKCREIYNTTKKSRYITDLDARNTDNCSYSYLHEESQYRRNSYRTLPNSIHIIDEAHERYGDTDDEDDEESLLEEWRELSEDEYEWCEYEEHHEDRYTSSIGCRCASLLGLVEVRSVEESESSE